MSDILTVEDVTKVLRLQPDSVRRLLRQGELPGRKVGRDWRVPRLALENHLGIPAAVAPTSPDARPRPFRLEKRSAPHPRR